MTRVDLILTTRLNVHVAWCEQQVTHVPAALVSTVCARTSTTVTSATATPAIPALTAKHVSTVHVH